MTKKKNRSHVERHLLENMFEKSLFSDLSLLFLHPSFPIQMRFDVHQAIVSQAPFFKQLLDNLDLLDDEPNNKEETRGTRPITTLHINLLDALLHHKFVLAPFQHIIRRKWQRSMPATHSDGSSAVSSHHQTLFNHILASHIRLALQWMYCSDKTDFINSIDDDDTLRLLAVAILFRLDDLANVCVDKYTTEQLSMYTIMRDLEHICQFPRSHPAYLQLRDASLRLLLRHGLDHPDALADLPADYMADVLNADMLFVGSEFQRYSLLRDVLAEFMRSVGDITWTVQGPVDQDHKRLSGFVRPSPSPITPSVVRSRKRKRIPSEELSPAAAADQRTSQARISFSANIPFQALVADDASGGVIDKATVLSYLLRNTVNYSNMTFDQLTTVRHDGIVDESIVFRALWQRVALRRLFFPEANPASQAEDEPYELAEQREALNDYFDVDDSDEKEQRRKLLLGSPKYRFCTSIRLPRPCLENGWSQEVAMFPSQVIDELTGVQQSVAESDEDEGENRESEEPTMDEDEELELLMKDEAFSCCSDSNSSFDDADDMNDDDDDECQKQTAITSSKQQRQRQRQLHEKITPNIKSPTDVVWAKTIYSKPKAILGSTYRIQIEAKAIPGAVLQLDDDDTEREDMLVCQFELERIIPTPSHHIANHSKSKIPVLSKRHMPEANDDEQPNVMLKSATFKTNSPPSTPQPQHLPVPHTTSLPNTYNQMGSRKAKVMYSVYCLNRFQRLTEDIQVDAEDRALTPVSECIELDGENESWKGYRSKVKIDSDCKHDIMLDMGGCIESTGIPRSLRIYVCNVKMNH